MDKDTRKEFHVLESKLDSLEKRIVDFRWFFGILTAILFAAKILN